VHEIGSALTHRDSLAVSSDESVGPAILRRKWTGESGDASEALRGSRSRLAELARLLHAVHEGDTISNKGQ
jgi:hypothetical protein